MSRFFKKIGSLLSRGSQAETRENSPHISKSLQIIAHVEKNLGPIYSTVSFNMFDNSEPLTIIIVTPNHENNYYTLVTAGMSYKAMLGLNGGTPSYSELVLCLPATWKAPENEDDIANLEDKDKWPLLLLLKLAEFPHKYKTCLGLGHSVPLGGDYQGFSHAMLNFTFLSENFEFLAEKTDDVIQFLGVYPITDAELEFKKQHGSDALRDWLFENDVSLVFDPDKQRVTGQL